LTPPKELPVTRRPVMSRRGTMSSVSPLPADAGARSGAGQRPLLGRRHICAGSERHSEGREQQ
jgi:hypothetical protein